MADKKILEDETSTVEVPDGVGPQLRSARESKGLTLDQIASETRISRRHLEHIEAGDFHELAGRTYAVGFARTYARTVGLNEADVAEMVRSEMDIQHPRERMSANSPNKFEPGDPARAPGGKLVWFSLFAVVLLLVGIFFAARVLFTPGADLPTLTEQEAEERAEELAAQRATRQQAEEPEEVSGEVVFTAQDEVWVRFYDAQDRVLYEGTMQEGDTYAIPADATGPKIITGRPQLLNITVGGTEVPRLAEEQQTIQDVDVSADALGARSTRAPSDAADPATTAPAT